jgi:hypothetical protein
MNAVRSGSLAARGQDLCVVALGDHVLVEIAGISRTCQGRRRS